MSARLEPDEPLRRLVIAPNGSLSIAHARIVFIIMCFISFGIASFAATVGLWLIWPYAGLETAGLGAALYVSLRDNAYREVVSIYAHSIEVEAGRNGPQRHWHFPRLLTRIQLTRGSGLHSPQRLLITRSGHGCELGRCLTDDERAAVAARLRSWVNTPTLV